MKTRICLILISTLLTSAALAADAPTSGKLKRLDPHGARNAILKNLSISDTPGCIVCHTQAKGGKVTVKTEPENTCPSCHGRLPHSGVMEHMGDTPGGGAGLNCLSCHRAHRATSTPAEPQKPSFIRLNPSATQLPAHLVLREAKNPLLDHPCSECHDFN